MNWQPVPNASVFRARGIDHNALVEYINDGWEWTLTFIHLYLIMSIHKNVRPFASNDEAQLDCEYRYGELIQQDFDNPLQTLPMYIADNNRSNENTTTNFRRETSGR